MARIVTWRWKSKFARFIHDYGVESLALALDVRPSAIYHWIRGATTPRPAHAEITQRLASESGSVLTMDEIYRHTREVRADFRRRIQSSDGSSREGGLTTETRTGPSPRGAGTRVTATAQ